MTRWRLFTLIIIFGLVALAALFYLFTTGKLIASHAAADASAKPSYTVLFVAGRDSHGEGEHEHRAGVTLLDAALRERYPDIATRIVYGGWPGDDSVFEGIDALVMYCDGGPFHPINRDVAAFETLVARGVGVAAIHYCVEVRKDSEASRAMLTAIGGYFETGFSVNPHWSARYTSLPEHPATERAAPFDMLDEWYFNLRFVPQLQRVTPLLRAIPPPQTMTRPDGPHSGNPQVRKLVAAKVPQVTAWVYEREDGGRGFGYTGGHFHHNWNNNNARAIVVDAIRWVAQGTSGD